MQKGRDMDTQDKKGWTVLLKDAFSKVVDAANRNPALTIGVLGAAVVLGTVFVLPVMPGLQATLIAGALIYGAPVVAGAYMDMRKAERALAPVPVQKRRI